MRERRQGLKDAVNGWTLPNTRNRLIDRRQARSLRKRTVGRHHSPRQVRVVRPIARMARDGE